MKSLLKSHTLAAVALATLCGPAAAYEGHDFGTRGGKFKKINLHGSGKQFQNPPGTKPNRALRRMKGR